jgi:hypothetical protein
MPSTREHFWRRDVTIAWPSAWDATRPAQVSWLHETEFVLRSLQSLRWSKYPLPFTEHKCPLPCSQDPVPPPPQWSCPEPNYTSSYLPISFVCSLFETSCVSQFFQMLVSSGCPIKILYVYLTAVFHAKYVAYHIIFYRSSHCYVEFPYYDVSSILLALSVFVILFSEKCNMVSSFQGLFKIINLSYSYVSLNSVFCHWHKFIIGCY